MPFHTKRQLFCPQIHGVEPVSLENVLKLSLGVEWLFGLKIVERDPNTKKVVSCHWKFCVYYGREVKVGTKRRKTTNIQYFKNPFQVDNYKSHMELQHPA